MTWTILPASHFPQHEEAWNALNAANGNSQLLDFAFVDAARRCFSGGAEVLGIFRASGSVECMGLFAPQSRFAWQTFQPANAPLGIWLGRPGERPEVFAHRLFRRLPGLPLLFGISQQDPDILPPPPVSATLGLLDYITTPRLRVAGTFDDYWASRSKNTRHNIKRQVNRLKRENLTVRLEIATEAQAMAPAVADYAALESSGWKGRESSAVTAGDSQSAFYGEILAHYAALGQASVWRYFIGDRLAASNLCLQRDGVLIILKTAYDESFHGLSPAQLMNYEALRQVFDGSRIRTIEFYGPVKEWHSRLTEEARTLYHINIYRWPWLKALQERRS